MWKVRECQTDAELEKIIDLRYTVLRKPWQQSRASATDELERTSLNAFIELEEEVIACGRLHRNEGNTGQVRYMAVSETFQGKGLGKTILDHLEKAGAENGLRKVQLQARQNAVAFYSAQGYRNLGPTFLLWGQIQHYLMEKELPGIML